MDHLGVSPSSHAATSVSGDRGEETERRLFSVLESATAS
jgi:hypothetical protein